MNSRKKYLLNYIFILGIILLFLNDHLFKWKFSNWITGKLSDFIGLLIFPFFLTFLFPKFIKWNVILTGLFFVFWKSSYSQGFIDLYNSITFIKITRVVDYSDLIALSVLPIVYYILKNEQILRGTFLLNFKIHPIIILLPSITVFMATSPPYWHGFKDADGNLKLYKTKINVKMSQKEILDKLITLEVFPVVDTTFRVNYPYILNFYTIDELILENDTIRDLKFSMVSLKKKNRTEIFINAMTISEDIKEAEVKQELRRYYRKLLKRYIRSKIKN